MVAVFLFEEALNEPPQEYSSVESMSGLYFNVIPLISITSLGTVVREK